MSDPFVSVPPTPPVVVTKPVKRQSRSGGILLAIAGFVAVAGVAFAAGRLTAPPAAAAGNNGGGRFGGFPGASFVPGQGFPGGGFQRGGGNGPGGFAGGRNIELQGQVTAVSDTSITIQLDNGSSVTVPVDSSTTYHQATSTNASSVAVGSSVVLQPGAANFTPGASPNPDASGAPGFGSVTFGPATDVTVVQGGAAPATP